MDTIDDKLSARIKSLQFSRKTLFYSLFAYLYDYQFGLGSSLEHMRPKIVPKQVISSINAAGESIVKKTAPESVLQSVTRRTTNPQERSIIHSYLKEVAGSG